MAAPTAPKETLDTIGKFQDEYSGRDAVHIAVFQATTAERLRPGQRVGLVDGLDRAGMEDRIRMGIPLPVSADAEKLVGIVDPFLPATTDRGGGRPFWVFLFPQTIRSLRHAWVHPSFPDET